MGTLDGLLDWFQKGSGRRVGAVMGGHPLWTMRRPPPRGASQVRLPIVSCSSTRSLHRLGATMPAASRRSCHLPEFGSAHANAGLFIKR